MAQPGEHINYVPESPLSQTRGIEKSTGYALLSEQLRTSVEIIFREIGDVTRADRRDYGEWFDGWFPSEVNPLEHRAGAEEVYQRSTPGKREYLIRRVTRSTEGDAEGEKVALELHVETPSVVANVPGGYAGSRSSVRITEDGIFTSQGLSHLWEFTKPLSWQQLNPSVPLAVAKVRNSSVCQRLFGLSNNINDRLDDLERPPEPQAAEERPALHDSSVIEGDFVVTDPGSYVVGLSSGDDVVQVLKEALRTLRNPEQ